MTAQIGRSANMVILNNAIAFKRFLEDYDLHIRYDQTRPNYYVARIQNRRGDALQREWAHLTGYGATEARARRDLMNQLNNYKYAYIGGECVGLPTPSWVDTEWIYHGGYWTLDTWQGYIALVRPTVYFIYEPGPESLLFHEPCAGIEDGKKQVEAYYDY